MNHTPKLGSQAQPVHKPRDLSLDGSPTNKIFGKQVQKKGGKTRVMQRVNTNFMLNLTTVEDASDTINSLSQRSREQEDFKNEVNKLYGRSETQISQSFHVKRSKKDKSAKTQRLFDPNGL